MEHASHGGGGHNAYTGELCGRFRHRQEDNNKMVVKQIYVTK
jgi:hypothetical protein